VFDVAAGREPDNSSRGSSLAGQRELNQGFGNALSTAVELAGTPALFGVIGWRLDHWLGTSPLLFLFLFVFTVCYQIWKFFGRYDAQMRDQEAKVVGLDRGNGKEPKP
jgi:F0F1-type ATP synthase assembly protein I